MKRLTLARVLLVLGIIFILAFVLALFVADQNAYGGGFNSTGIGIIVIGALALLVAAGSLTYGKDSHYAKAWARIRPARQRPRRGSAPQPQDQPGPPSA